MNWYYAVGDGQNGPVDPVEFDRLVEGGIITPDTLVWREGMPGWIPHREVAAAELPAGSTSVSAGVLCSECGGTFPADEVIQLGERPVCGGCKPVVLQKLREGAVDADAERIRREHISHEASVRSVGILYFIGAVLSIAIAVMTIVLATQEEFLVAAIAAGVLLVIGGAQLWVGIGLRRLRSWARIPTAILSGIGLLGFPLGTLINAYILYLVLSRKGAMVFSDDYKAIMEQTPHIKYRMSIIVWIVLGILLLIILLAIVGGIASRQTGN
jgi:hypothetical protein